MNKALRSRAVFAYVLLFAFLTSFAIAADWPMWRRDAGRTAATDEALPPTLHLQWVREYPPLKTAWPDPILETHRMPFDRVYQPVVEGKTLYVGSSRSDKVVALDADTGEEKWTFYADGPVRFAPVAWKGKVYFTSDDGCLYCVNGKDGALVWKVRGGPSDRMVLGNDRLISTWPARGGPALGDGVVYFAAGVWPFMGVFVHAVDAETGKIIWTNSGSGQIYILQPHDSPAFSGLAPQGALVVAGDKLLVPNGRAVPACLDRRTGRLLYFNHAAGKSDGGSHVAALGDRFFNSTRMAETRTTLGKAWNGEWSVKTSVDKGKWTATVRVPFATVGGPPGPDAVWHFNFCRGAYRKSPQFVIDAASLGALKTSRMSSSTIKELETLKDKAFDDRNEFEAALSRSLNPKDLKKDKDKILSAAGPHRRSVWSPSAYPLDAQYCAAIGFDDAETEWVVPSVLDSAPKLDGALSDPAWRKGLRLSGFLAVGTYSEPAAFATSVTVLRDAQAIYLGFECEQPTAPDLKIKADEPDEDVTGDESIEIYLDRHDSSMVYYRLAFNAAGCRYDALDGRKIESYRSKPHSYVYDLASGKRLADVGEEPALTEDAIYTMGNPVGSYQIVPQKDKTDVQKLWECPVDGRYALIKAGERLYVGGKGALSAIDIPDKGGEPKVGWTADVQGTPWGLLAADGRLFAVTLEGRIYCFGAEKRAEAKTYPVMTTEPPPADKWSELADQIIAKTNIREGYCVVAGLETGRLAEELARRTDLHVIAIDPAAEKVEAIRKRLDAAGLYGHRVAVHVGDPKDFPLPPYIAGLISTEKSELSDDAAKHLFASLRPYSGALCLPGEEIAIKRRDGPLPDTADWTHQDADIANTLCSQDDRVRLPLGVLWFGGPPPAGMISRHGHPPTELVAGGRIFVSGVDLIRAVDVYTGRVLWEAQLPGVGYRYSTDYHSAGVNRLGSIMAAADDALYAVNGRECLRLDPATGKKEAVFALPAFAGDEKPFWGFVGVWEDLLIAGSTPTFDGSGSRQLAVMDRKTGKAAWTRDAAASFLHNGIVAGGGRLYCLDKHSPGESDRLTRRGGKSKVQPKLLCLDIRKGDLLWEKEGDVVFGTRLALSEPHGILLLSGRPGDGMRGEVTDRLAAFSAKDGNVLWDEKIKGYRAPPILHGDTIIAQPGAWDLRTGRPRMRTDPVTGEEVAWSFTRNYGCNTVAGAKRLLTFRSASAGFYDLAGDGGTGNFGGFKSGCSINLIAANGVLAAPDFSATCTCSYQNQTSLGLIHMPENEIWTTYTTDAPAAPPARVGLNLGAPGDRLAEDGTLWLEYPTPRFEGRIIVGGESWPVKATIEGGDYFCRHSSTVQGDGLCWVAASGCRGIEKIALRVKPGTYTVRLHFAEPDALGAGDRVFSIFVQDASVLENFDVVKEAGGPNRCLVREIANVKVSDELSVRFQSETANHPPILCGLEVVRRE
ncbi:MAG: PQQ-binding-like beta-propeller repeat protein [Planctomycetota bacterium]